MNDKEKKRERERERERGPREQVVEWGFVQCLRSANFKQALNDDIQQSVKVLAASKEDLVRSLANFKQDPESLRKSYNVS